MLFGQDNENKPKSMKKPKAARKINFDEDKSSPVSGCIIKDLSDCEEGKVVYGDIDSSYNYNCPNFQADSNLHLLVIFLMEHFAYWVKIV
jgi:hypothetical protein